MNVSVVGVSVVPATVFPKMQDLMRGLVVQSWVSDSHRLKFNPLF